ncbi:MAG: 4-hydroxy-3-methylbut-2-enyl diphosphate reductase [Candidatus Sumerlaeaceae bacterium]
MTDPAATLKPSPIGKPDAATGIYRHGFGLKSAVEQDISGDYTCQIVDCVKQADYTLELPGLEINLAREFGFCYGVDKAIDYAYQTRRMFPDKRIFLTTEIIHNPRVNRRLLDMGIQFLSGQYKGDTGYDEVTPDDVVILPAFGASVQEVETLRKRSCTIVDTTCGSVIHVWKRVEKYAKEGFTAVIHGKYSHEETIGTSSHVTQFPGGQYIVVRDKDEAQLVCDFIRGTVPVDVIRNKFSRATLPGFDPERDLQRVGVANQTTMLSSESLEIAGMLKQAMADRYTAGELDAHFRSFDTICSATQERQDAVQALVARDLDLILVVGGFNSSNTTHLIEIANHYTRAFHIEDVAHLVSPTELRHKRWDSHQVETAENWLPKLPLRVGFTAGASTPNRAIGEVIERVVDFCGLAGELRQRCAASHT